VGPLMRSSPSRTPGGRRATLRSCRGVRMAGIWRPGRGPGRSTWGAMFVWRVPPMWMYCRSSTARAA
jgi:hypothetical protein